jgi:hypothetical protein
MPMGHEIVVRTNVPRDLLQSAAVFKNERLVVWEYVANSLQYMDAGVVPNVEVELAGDARRITISDNGRGMDREELQNFFTMHGENQDRKRGRGGRGRFGTGKSAAFGIAARLVVTSVRNGRRNSVVLDRKAIDRASADGVPITTLERDVPTEDANGTVIEISEIKLPRLDVDGVVRYIERHLTRWAGRPIVQVNRRVCEPAEPVATETFEVMPSEAAAAVIGPGPLRLRVAASPLEKDQQGVSIFANGSWQETTLVGLDGKPCSDRIFGEIDVPALDDDAAEIPAFDNSRSMSLNPANPVVQALYAFIGPELERLRNRLVSEDRVRRQQAEARRLQREADRIAEIINGDFNEFVAKVEPRRRRVIGRGGSDAGGQLEPDPHGEEQALKLRDEGQPAADETGDGGGGGGGGGGEETPPDVRPAVEPAPDGEIRGVPQPYTRKPKARGGFKVEFENLGTAEKRARYLPEDRKILINLDHPQITAARGGGDLDQPLFRRLSYEVAFTEYSIALASELNSAGEFYDPSDAIFEMREAINRLAVRGAALFGEGRVA